MASIRWAAWAGDTDLPLVFPPGWAVTECPPADAPDIGAGGIDAAFAAPIGSPSIRDLARGARRACVVIDDLTRPTAGARLVPPVLAELNAGGIPDEAITILAGIANHRPMLGEDLRRKVGDEVLARCRVSQHLSWEGCTPLGTTSRGTPVEINAAFMAADVRILVGSIIPHAGTGFSGGAKLLMPGIASIGAAEAFHRGPAMQGRYDVVETEARLDAEEAARLAGVSAIVNSVPTSRMGIAGLVVGDVVAAHRAGVAIAQSVFATHAPANADVAVLSLYPKDGEFLQHLTAFSPYKTAPEPIVRAGGSIVVALAATEGFGYHALFGPGRRLAAPNATRVRERDVVFFCPNLYPTEVPEGTTLHRSWDETLAWLNRKHGDAARVSVFPCATMQLGR
ncbi:MAG TPA: lactate racemase domain-containing protein [Acidimicrobiales bacterium]|nr:lactate racemase domain-containing protein [Acidimicrobiales bacterium]